MDRVHHERRLHGVHRAIARIDALDLARDQAIGYVVRTGAAVLLGERHTEQAEFTHFGENLSVRALFEVGVDHARQQASIGQ